MVALSSLAIPSKHWSSGDVDDLKKVLTSNGISFILWEHFSEEKCHM